jgi:HAD superfamily hydrolase (TIGR01509 family)
MKSAVIFDMDGVLVDSESIYFEHLMDFFDLVSIEPFSRNIEDYVGASTEATWRKLIPNPQKREQIYREYLHYGQQHRLNYATILTQGAKELLQFLCSENMKIALASAGRPMDIEQMLDDCGLREYFDVIISGESVKRNKPAPDVYLETLAQLNVEAPEALVIEDSAKGIAAATSAAIEVWAVKQPYSRIDQTGASRRFNNLPDIQENLRKMLLV